MRRLFQSQMKLWRSGAVVMEPALCLTRLETTSLRIMPRQRQEQATWALAFMTSLTGGLVKQVASSRTQPNFKCKSVPTLLQADTRVTVNSGMVTPGRQRGICTRIRWGPLTVTLWTSQNHSTSRHAKWQTVVLSGSSRSSTPIREALCEQPSLETEMVAFLGPFHFIYHNSDWQQDENSCMKAFNTHHKTETVSWTKIRIDVQVRLGWVALPSRSEAAQTRQDWEKRCLLLSTGH